MTTELDTPWKQPDQLSLGYSPGREFAEHFAGCEVCKASLLELCDVGKQLVEKAVAHQEEFETRSAFPPRIRDCRPRMTSASGRKSGPLSSGDRGA